MDEYRRQLYVAMTRARDELYVCGYAEKLKPDSWYDLVSRGVRSHPRVTKDEDGTLRVKGSQEVPPQDRIETEAALIAANSKPNWALKRAEATPKAPRSRAPSRLMGPRIPADSARRGRAIHALFQHVPEISPASRKDAALRMLARRGFAPQEAHDIAVNVLTLIENPQFAPFFSASLAEVPFAARFGDSQAPIHGQIDRLVVTGNEVFILDFKTDRSPPRTAAGVAPAYLVQLAAYRFGIAQVFPGKPIRAAILWTEIPSLMEFRNDILENALSAYHNPGLSTLTPR